MTQSTPSPLQLKSAQQLLIPIGEHDDFAKIQRRLFGVGAGWRGATLDTLTQEIETTRPQALLVRQSGVLSLIMFDEDLELYHNALTITPKQLFAVSLSDFKLRIQRHQQQAQRKQAFTQSLEVIKQMPDEALTDDAMKHLDALRKLAEQHGS